MPFLYASGQYANLLERALSVTLSPAVDALFPATNLYDGRLSRACKHGSNSSPTTITADLAAFTPGTAASYTITVRSGERRRVTSSGTSNVKVQNLTTGRYLQSNGTWGTSANCLTAAGSLSYQVESLTVCQALTVSLAITQSASVTLSDWPRWNALVVHGHNIDPALTVEARSSTDNFAANDVLVATATVLQPGFFVWDSTGAVTSRYVRLKLTGTNSAIPWYAEVCPCWLESGTAAPDFGYEVALAEAQVRNEGRFGLVGAANLSPYPRRTVRLNFGVSSTGATEVRQEIAWRSRGGVYPLYVVPVSTESAVYCGRLTDKFAETRAFHNRWDSDITIAEDAILTPLA